MALRKTRKRVPTDVNFQLQAELARTRVLDGSTADIWGRPCALQDAGQSSRPNPLDARNTPPPSSDNQKGLWVLPHGLWGTELLLVEDHHLR